jgi:hypothetical protein
VLISARGWPHGVFPARTFPSKDPAGSKQGTGVKARGGRIEQVFDYDRPADPHDLERLRRSIVMLPPGHSAGALTREPALA